MEDLKKKVEALLFSSARRMTLEELSKLCRHNPEEIKTVMSKLKKEYEEKNSSLIIINEGYSWKLTTRDDYIPLVKNIVSKTELTKTLMETLAVIAFKYPIKQADLIKIRTNKAYDHLKELEEMGYITRQKYGRTKLIKLSDKFFDYFSLPQEKLKDQFSDFEGLAKAIENKEEEIKKIKEDQKKKAKESKSTEIDLLDEKGHKVKLKVIDEPEKEEQSEKEEQLKPQIYTDNINDLEIVDVPEPPKKEEPKPEEQKTEEEPEGIELDDEQEDKVNERVNEILGLKEEPKENTSEEPTEEVEEQSEEEITQEKEEENEPEIREEEEQPTENQTEKPTLEEKEETEEEMSDVDKKVDAMLNPQEEEPEKLADIDESKWGNKTSDNGILKNNKKSKEPKDLLDAAFEEEEQKKDKNPKE